MILKRMKFTAFIFGGLLIASILVFKGNASAYTFNPNNIIDDAIFNDSSTMSAAQIDAFLNSFPSSCISTNNGFSSPNVTGYNPSQGYLYGSNVSAGTVISSATRAYDLNPRVILATLQKEQSLVTGGAGCHPETPPLLDPCPQKPYGTINPCVTGCQYSGGCIYIALGYDCPYYCSPRSVGFSAQIIKATWKLKFVQQRSLGNFNWNVQKPGWDNSDDPPTQYDGYMTQGYLKRNSWSSPAPFDGNRPINGNSITVHLDTGATASLYSYTPFLSGGQSFFNHFTNWFGSTSSPTFQATFVTHSAYPAIVTGGTSDALIRYRNTGNLPWYDDVSAPQYNTYPVRLAKTNPINTSSPFSALWPSSGRATGAFARVYESDGVSLSSNQHVALPGQIVDFGFTFSIPSGTAPGFYPQYFQPVLEGSNWWNMGGVAWIGVTVQQPTFQATFVTHSAYPAIVTGGTSDALIRYRNTGNLPWYDDVSAPQYNTYPVRLAKTNPINTSSPFSALWPSSGRATGAFARVYESDGVSLSSNQHVALPGQIVDFGFTFSIPSGTAPGFYPQYFQPVLEGSNWWNMGGVAWIGVTVQ